METIEILSKSMISYRNAIEILSKSPAGLFEKYSPADLFGKWSPADLIGKYSPGGPVREVPLGDPARNCSAGLFGSTLRACSEAFRHTVRKYSL